MDGFRLFAGLPLLVLVAVATVEAAWLMRRGVRYDWKGYWASLGDAAGRALLGVLIQGGVVGGLLMMILKTIEYHYLVIQYPVEIFGTMVAVVFAGAWLLHALRDLHAEKERLRLETASAQALQASLEWQHERERQQVVAAAAAAQSEAAEREMHRSVTVEGDKAAVGMNPSSGLDNGAAAQRTGREGLEDLIRDGRIRHATAADQGLWLSAQEQSGDPRYAPRWRHPLTEDEMAEIYVVLRNFRFPPNMSSMGSARFIVPQGVPQPQGDPGHSKVFIVR